MTAPPPLPLMPARRSYTPLRRFQRLLATVRQRLVCDTPPRQIRHALYQHRVVRALMHYEQTERRPVRRHTRIPSHAYLALGASLACMPQ